MLGVSHSRNLASSAAIEYAGQVPSEAKMFTLFVGLIFCVFGLTCFLRYQAVAGFLQSLVSQTGTRANGEFPSPGYVRGFGVLFLAVAIGLCTFAIALLSGWNP